MTAEQYPCLGVTRMSSKLHTRDATMPFSAKRCLNAAQYGVEIRHYEPSIALLSRRVVVLIF